MMKWWLKLYTINTVLTFSKWLCLSWVLDYVLTLVDGVDGFVGIGVYAIPVWGGYKGFFENSFRANLEFHKMSVPFKELKKAFYTHLVLVYSFFIIAMATSFGVSSLFSGALSRLPYFSLSQYLLAAVAGFIFFLYTNSFHRGTIDKYAFYDSKISFLKKIYRLILSFIGVCVLISLESGLALGIVPPMMMASIMLGAALFYSRSMFHQSLPRAGMKQYFGYSALGVLASLAIFFTMAFMGRNDFENKKLSSADRLDLIFFWQPVTPSIDKELFVELEPTLNDTQATISLYQAISPKELNQIPFTFFIDIDRPQRLEAFLNLGKPDAKNLVGLLDHMESKKEYWEKVHKNTREAYKSWIHENWPSQEKFPERHIVARLKWEELHPKEFKVTTKRMIASEVPTEIVKPVAPEEQQ